MITKFLPIILIIGLFSCKGSSSANVESKPEKILNLKNVTGSTIKMQLVNKYDSLTILLPNDSIVEIVSLRDSCYLFSETAYEQIIKEKIDYLSYQKSDSTIVVLINEEKDIFLTDIDIVTKAMGSLSVLPNENNVKIERTIMNYPLE